MLAGSTDHAHKAMIQVSTAQVSIKLATNKRWYLSSRSLNTLNKGAKVASQGAVQSRLFRLAPLVGLHCHEAEETQNLYHACSFVSPARIDLYAHT